MRMDDVRVCAVEGCPNVHKARGYCLLHYSRLRRHGDPLGTADRAPKGAPRPCSVEGCDRAARSHGMCRPHDMRMQTYGDPLGGRRVWRRRGPEDTSCANPACDADRKGKSSHCSPCGYRLSKYGSFDQPPSRLKPDGYKAIDPHGYVRVMRRNHPMASAKGYVLEHRLVMSEHLGRNLVAEESVHHLNGDKTDNRLENLELWVGYGAQPSGQRPRDLVEWAKKIIDKYGDEVERGLL